LYIKNRLRGYTPFWQIYTKFTNFGDLGAVSPHFKSDNGEIWREGIRTLDTFPSALYFVKSLMEICPLGEYFYQKFEIFAIISSYLSPYFYADNVKILLKRTDGLRNPSTKQIFVKIAQVAVQYFIAPRM